MSNAVESISLCIVWSDQKGQKWLDRLADVNNNKLTLPAIDSNLPRTFANRSRLILTDNSFLDKTVGVWKWTAIPNTNNQSKDYISTNYQGLINPVRFVLLKNISSLIGLKSAILSGITRPFFICDTVFCINEAPRKYIGLLCQKTNLVADDFSIHLERSIYSLPIYRFSDNDILTINNDISFIKNIKLPIAQDSYPMLDNPSEVVLPVFLKRLSWPFYKQCIGKTKAEWHDCKMLLDQILNTHSLYEDVSSQLQCTTDQAREVVNKFAVHAHEMLSLKDIDSDLLAKIALKNNELRQECETHIESQWKESHAKELTAAKEKLDSYMQLIEQAGKDYQGLEAKKRSLLQDLNQLQAQHEQLKQKLHEHEVLGNKTAQAIREKINAAKQDMAGFLADLSIFMPQNQNNTGNVNNSCDLSATSYWTFCPGLPLPISDSNSIEECSQWSDILYLMIDNLNSAGVNSQLTNLFAAFLYSAYLNKLPLLLAGPNALSIANAVSCTLLGKSISVLKCYGDMHQATINSFTQDDFVAVENPFHPHWLTCMPQLTQNRFSLWLHPFVEDLSLEPFSLWNYVLPVLTDCLVDNSPSEDQMSAGKIQENFVPFISEPQNTLHRSKLLTVKHLDVSNLVLNRLNKIFCDAKHMLNKTDIEIETLFGLLPLAYLNHKTELLSEVLDSNQSLKREIKEAIQHYIRE